MIDISQFPCLSDNYGFLVHDAASGETAAIASAAGAAMRGEARSFIGRLGKFVQPVFQPLGYDWRLTIGVLTSFAAREVFASTMAVVIAGSEEVENEGVRNTIAHATRDDGKTLVFTPAVAWSVLVFFVLAMQCLPTLVLTAKEAGGAKWAFLQLGWMTLVAYLAAWLAFTIAS